MIQRYDVVWRDEGYEKVKDVDGDYVLYSDHNAVADALTNKAVDAMITSTEWMKKYDGLKKDLETWGVVEIAVRNPNVASYMDHWECRALRAEEENAELKGIIAGLQDVAAGRVRPFVDIQNELESK